MPHARHFGSYRSYHTPISPLNQPKKAACSVFFLTREQFWGGIRKVRKRIICRVWGRRVNSLSRCWKGATYCFVFCQVGSWLEEDFLIYEASNVFFDCSRVLFVINHRHENEVAGIPVPHRADAASRCCGRGYGNHTFCHHRRVREIAGGRRPLSRWAACAAVHR